jgi:hypothetical protein
MILRWLLLPIATLILATPLQAQRRADLRYAVTDSTKLVYQATDETRIEPLNAPDSARTTESRVVYEVLLRRLDDLMTASVAVRDSAAEPVEQTISARGPRPDPTDERSLDALLTVGPLLYLPGREVALHETWTDTIGFMTERAGTPVKVRTIITGTYAGDTIVDGASLHVVEFRTADIMATETQAATMTLIGSTSGGRRERVLWDPRRRAMVYREAHRETTHEVETTTGARTTLEKSRVVLRLIEG